MPTVTIDGRTLEVAAGTNLVEAAKRVGVQIPHYCYHPRLSVVGQCRMCLVKIEGMPKLQTACTTQIMKDGMSVQVDDEEVRLAQEGIMEFLLINHPLDCPVCDQAGECGLQDYSFKHGQAFSRFAFEEKRTYPGRERIPLGPNVVLNMNRCIQCTRCIRFTEEISGTGELGFFQRGARTEIGVFPGEELDNPLSTCVVDICPVGALTSTQFRFAERVWFLDKSPSICTGCDVGCNITIEHRKGVIRRYKPRLNPQVNDHWMCDYGRSSFAAHESAERLTVPWIRDADGGRRPASWVEALDLLHERLAAGAGERPGFLCSGHLSTEEAYLLRRIADSVGSPHRAVATLRGPKRSMPRPGGLIHGDERAPNRRGAVLAGLEPGPSGLDAEQMANGALRGPGSVLIVADAELAELSDGVENAERFRQAEFLAVFAWSENALTAVADLVLPIANHAERSGTFVNVENRMQRFERAFPPPGEARAASSILLDLLARFDEKWTEIGEQEVFRLLVEPPLVDTLDAFPAHGIGLDETNVGTI